MKQTTIRLSIELKKKLRSFAIHPRETDEQLLERAVVILNKYKGELNRGPGSVSQSRDASK